MKKFITLLLTVNLVGYSVAQIPAGYYDSANGLTGYELKSELYGIISNGALDLGYGAGTGGLWETYFTSDVDNYYENNGSVLDMYSENPGGVDPYEYRLGQWFNGGNQCTSVDFTEEGKCYNREHSLPKSYFGSAAPMNNDAHFVVPTDFFVNQQRSNYPYGETNSPSWTSKNGSKVGSSDFPGYYGVVFEPIDEFKGDFARMHLYFVTRYQDRLQNFNRFFPNINPIDGTTDRGYKQWYVNLLLKWANQDPVSQKEIDRNNAVYARQKNRNPFIDHPEWVNLIWTTTLSNEEVSTFSKSVSIYPNPVRNGELYVAGYGLEDVSAAHIYSAEGKLIQTVTQNFKNNKKIILKNQTKGVYFLKVNNQSVKFIVN